MDQRERDGDQRPSEQTGRDHAGAGLVLRGLQVQEFRAADGLLPVPERWPGRRSLGRGDLVLQQLRRSSCLRRLPEVPAPCPGLWDGAVDTVGGKVLENILSQTKDAGIVSSCGNAADKTNLYIAG